MTDFLTMPAALTHFRDRTHAVEVLRLVMTHLPGDKVTLWIDPHTDDKGASEYQPHQSYLRQRMSETRAQVPWWRRLGEGTPRLSAGDSSDVEAFCGFAYSSIAAEIRVFEWVRRSSVFDMNDTGAAGAYQLPEGLYRTALPSLIQLGLPAGWPTVRHDGGDAQSAGD